MTTVPLVRVNGNVPALDPHDYMRFSQLLLDQCGLYFSDNRQAELELGVRHAFAASTCTDLNDYYRLLLNPAAGAVEMDRLINAVTVSETHFFRDAAQFDALYTHVLPQIIERRRPLRTMRIWSAGCASGEEPYSIAMLLRELLPDVDAWSITILGTDINTEALGRARQATYGEWAFREDRAKLWRPRFFQLQGSRYELIPPVHRMVSFAKLNLANDGYLTYEANTAPMDLILCRNVTIYFSEAVTRQVIGRFYDALPEGGWLVPGHSEPSLTLYRSFQVRNFADTVLYQRVSQPMVLPAQEAWPPTPKIEPQLSPLPVVAPIPVTVPTPTPDSAAEEGDPIERARQLLEYGRSEEVCKVLISLTQSGPNKASACALLGQAYANLGRWQEAEHWCGQAVRLNRLKLEAYYTLALVLQHQKKLDQAIDAMKKVIYLDRANVLGHFGLANLYHEKHQLPQAIKSLENANRLLGAHPDEELVTGSGGITIGRLREAVMRQRQVWSA